MVDPLRNPGVSPTAPAMPPTGGQPLSTGQEGTQPKPFSLAPEPLKGGAAAAEATSKPSPMEVAREARQQKQRWTPEEMSSHLDKLQDTLTNAKINLANPAVTARLTPDHLEALEKLTTKMSPDIRTIADASGAPYEPMTKGKGEGLLSFITNWVNASQITTSAAQVSDPNVYKTMDLSKILGMQAAIQRASTKGELFSSIMGSTISGLKSLMMTQLG